MGLYVSLITQMSGAMEAHRKTLAGGYASRPVGGWSNHFGQEKSCFLAWRKLGWVKLGP